MCMTPRFKIEFCLIKNDGVDFDRDEVSNRLGISPTETAPPTLSRGRLYCDDLATAKEELRGLTILSSDAPPYEFLKNAFWCVELNTGEGRSICEPLKELESLIAGSVDEIPKVCSDFGLFAEVILRIYCESNELPEMELPADVLSFFANIGASISFDLQLD